MLRAMAAAATDPLLFLTLAMLAAAVLWLHLRLRAAERRAADHARRFALLDGWADDVDNCLEGMRAARRQAATVRTARRGTGGTVLPFKRNH